MSEIEQDPYIDGLDLSMLTDQRLHAIQMHANRLVTQRGGLSVTHTYGYQTEHASLKSEAVYHGYGSDQLSVFPDVSLELVGVGADGDLDNLPGLQIAVSGAGAVNISCHQASECGRAIDELEDVGRESKSGQALLDLAKDLHTRC